MYKKRNRRYSWTIAATLFLLALLVYLSLSYGMIELTFTEISETLLGIHETGEYDVLVHQFRLPRLVIAGLVGAGLGVAGAVCQGVSRNSLADPGILGINAGAGFAIVVFLFFYQGNFTGEGWVSVLAMPFFGLFGGLGAMILIYLFSWHNARLDPQRVLLTGIAIGAGFGALSVFFSLKMNPTDFNTVTAWSIGSLLHANWKYIVAVLPWFIILLPIILWKSSMLDLFQLEEGSTRSLGVSVGREQAILLFSSTGLVSACVAVAGSVSFVGLIVPHIAKVLVGVRHSQVVPLSGLIGMVLVIAADFAAKNIFAPAEIAVGIVISLIGVPYFIFLLFKSKT